MYCKFFFLNVVIVLLCTLLLFEIYILNRHRFIDDEFRWPYCSKKLHIKFLIWIDNALYIDFLKIKIVDGHWSSSCEISYPEWFIYLRVIQNYLSFFITVYIYVFTSKSAVPRFYRISDRNENVRHETGYPVQSFESQSISDIFLP